MIGAAEIDVPTPEATGASAAAPPRGRLFRKYVALFVAVVFVALLVNGLFEIWFSYRDHEASLIRIQREQAEAAAAKIDQFVTEIQNQLGWTTQLPWSAEALEQHRFDALRLLRQVPAITELAQLDASGHERLRVSRLATDVLDSGADFSHDPKFTEALAHKVWYGPVYFRRESEPYMTLAVAGARRDAGVSVAEVNLKLIWDVVSQIKVGERGQAYVVDAGGRLIAHPDISLVLRDTDLSQLPQVQAARGEASGAAAGPLRAVRDFQGREVLSAHAAIAPLGWLVFVELPIDEAYAPLYASIARSGALLLAGLVLAFLAGLFLARRMVVPIRRLQESAEKLGEGDLSQRIAIKTGDEIETLADRFNLMAGKIQDSYATLEAKVEARTRDLSEALEQQTATTEVLQVINSSPGDLAPVFDALLDRATRLCGATFSVLTMYRGGDLHEVVAMRGMPPALNDLFQKPVHLGPETGLGRLVRGESIVHIADARDDEGYRKGNDVRRALVDVAGARTYLAVPLRKEDMLLGAFTIYRQEVRPFSSKQIALLENFAAQAVIAIENTRLMNETREALDQQTATAEVLQVINTCPGDLVPVFESILEKAHRLCGVAAGSLQIYDGTMFRAVAAHGLSAPLEERLRHGYVPGPNMPTRRLIEGERMVHIADLAEIDDPMARSAVELGGTRTLLGVALRKDDRLLGQIVAVRHEVRPFSEKEIALLESFAAQAVIAMENARLITETREALEQQTATADVLKVISRSAFHLQSVFDTLTASAATLCEADQGIIFLLEGEAYHAQATFGAEPAYLEFLKANPRRLSDKSIVPRVARSGRVEHIPDKRLDPDYQFPGVAKFRDPRTLLGVPLLREGKVEGVFTLVRIEQNPFTRRQIDLVQTFADQAVIALENVRLFEQVEARTRDLSDALQQQTATAEVLKVISRSAFDLDAVLGTLAQSAATLCNADTCIINLRHDEVFRPGATFGGTPAFHDYLKTMETRPGRHSVSARVALSGAVEQVIDVQADPEIDRPGLRQVTPNRSVIGVPLLRESKVEGIFVLGRNQPVAFTQRQIDLVQTFADQAVIAIENARLFEQVQARTRELARSLDELRAAQDRLIQSEKMASLGQLTAGIAHEIKNPLNFVNNFASLSAELVGELKELVAAAAVDADEATRADFEDLVATLSTNLAKIGEHGKRADGIVKSMLLHSRGGSGEAQETDLNALIEEAMALAYHGLRAQDKSFNITMERDLDPAVGRITAVPQDLTRVFLNLIGNGFYAANKRKRDGGDAQFSPLLKVTTRSLGETVEIRVRDNGVGIPDEVRAKLFTPFFTTKPTGEGTGLGLSISYDIVTHGHGGRIGVESQLGTFTEFIVRLPRAMGPANKNEKRGEGR